MISRSSKLRPVITSFFSIALWLILPVGSSDAQSSPFDDGPMQLVSDAMQELIRVKIVDRRLDLRRDWGEDDGQDPQDMIDAEVKRLKAKGWDGDTAARVAERQIRRKLGENPFVTTFFGLASQGSSSVQRTSSGSRKTISFQNSNLRASGELTHANNGVLIRVLERNGPRRELIVESQGKEQFFLKYSGSDFLVELKQHPDSGVFLTRQLEEKKEQFHGMNFIELRKRHPKLVDGWLLPLMEHVGCSVPLLADDSEIVKAVYAKLASYQSRADEFEKLVKKLDSADYQTRTNANEQILANKDNWKGQIEKKLESDDLPMETRVRLAAALAASESETQVEELIRDQELLNSPEYLIGLLETAEANQTQLVINRLRQITELRFAKPEQWKRWLQQKTDREVSTPDPPGNNSKK